MKLRVGQSMLVVRVPVGQTPPPGFQARDGAVGSHHGRYSTHAVKVLPSAKKKPRKKKRRRTRNA